MTTQKQTEHSRNFEKYKGYYDHGFWNAKMLKNAVMKKAITADEFEEITGEAYTKQRKRLPRYPDTPTG